MLNGVDSRYHHQELIKQAENYRLGQVARAAYKNSKQPSALLSTQKIKQLILTSTHLLVK